MKIPHFSSESRQVAVLARSLLNHSATLAAPLRGAKDGEAAIQDLWQLMSGEVAECFTPGSGLGSRSLREDLLRLAQQDRQPGGCRCRGSPFAKGRARAGSRYKFKIGRLGYNVSRRSPRDPLRRGERNGFLFA